jgi:hypothetical protein
MTILAALVPGRGTTMWRILEALGIAILAPLVMIGVMIVMGFVEGLTDSFWAYSLSGRAANPWLSALGYVFIGAEIGFASADALPWRLLHAASPISGISLLLAPLAAGLLMHAYGSWRVRQPKDCSWLATFWAGALFAFSIALVRWTIIGRVA